MKTSTTPLTVSQAGDALSSQSSLMTVMGSLALIVFVMLAMAWLFRRSGLNRRISLNAGGLKVVASQSLGSRERLVLVDVGDQRLVLGVTVSQITCLTRMDKPEAEPPEMATATASFKAVFDSLRQKYRQDKK